MAIKWADQEKPAAPRKIRWEEAPPVEPMPKRIGVDAWGVPTELPQEVHGAPTMAEQVDKDILAGMSMGERLVTGFDRDITRIGQSIKQMNLHAANAALNMPLEGARKLLPESVDNALTRAQQYMGKATADYDARLRMEKEGTPMLDQDTAANVGGFLGTAAVTAPLSEVGGGGLLASTGKQALSGAVQGALQPVTDKDGFAAAKARQAGVGAALGGGINALGYGAGKVLEEGAGNALRRGYNALSGKAAKGATAQEGEALAAKHAIGLTPGQVSGGKTQIAAENMARQSIFTRQKVFDTDMKIADQYSDAINKSLDKLAKSGDKDSAGAAIKQSYDAAVDRLSKQRSRVAAEDFKAVDDLADGMPHIEPSNFAREAERLSEENTKTLLGGNADTAKMAKAMDDIIAKLYVNRRVPGEKQSTLDSALGKRVPKPVATTQTVLAPQTAADLIRTRRNLSQIAGGTEAFSGPAGQPIQVRAAASLLKAIDDDIEQAAARGGALGDALKAANDRYKAYSQKIDGVKKGPLGKILGKDMVDEAGDGFGSVSSDQIFDKFSKLSPDHIGVALKAMSPEAQQQVKRAYVQRALDQAQMPTAGGGAKQVSIRPTTFVGALQKTPDDKRRIAALFSPTERQELDELMNLGRRIGDRTGENTSGTAAMSQAMGVVEKLRSLTFKGAAEVAGSYLGTSEIARLMADSGGRAALMELRKLPPTAARARELSAYLGTILGKDSANGGASSTSEPRRK